MWKMNIYVGNLPYKMSDKDLGELFSQFGAVDSARIITDKETGRAKGFGFVEMSNQGEAEDAIKGLEGKEVGGRNLKVNEARPREDKPSRGPRRY